MKTQVNETETERECEWNVLRTPLKLTFADETAIIIVTTTVLEPPSSQICRFFEKAKPYQDLFLSL
jgi:hypothetical protein